MLVALMESMLARSQMNNAQYAMMCNRRNMMSVVRNMPAFCGNMEALHTMDMQFAMSQAQNETLYLISQAQEKAARARLEHELKNYKISYTA